MEFKVDQAELSEVNKVLAAAGVFNQDAGIFTARQLEFVRNKIYEEKMPNMNGLRLVPISSEAPEWAETVVERIFDTVGMAKIIANYADDLPRADVAAKERAVKVKDIGASYGFSVGELRTASAMGTELPTSKARAARRAIETKLNQIALVGDAEYGLNGFITHPNLGEVSLAGGWKAATAEKVLEEIETIINTVIIQSKGVHNPTHLVMSLTDHQAIGSKRLPDSNGKTVLQFLKEKYTGLTIEGIWELEKASARGDKNLVICYEKNKDNLSLELPKDFEQFPAQERNLELVVNCLARVGGVFLRYPLSAVKAEV